MAGDPTEPMEDADFPRMVGRAECCELGDGTRYWYGAMEGEEDDEVGKEGTIVLNARLFRLGTIITVEEPVNESD